MVRCVAFVAGVLGGSTSANNVAVGMGMGRSGVLQDGEEGRVRVEEKNLGGKHAH